MTEVSNVFQQYAQEYILAAPGSEKESEFFNKIIKSFTPLLKIESSLLTRSYYEEFVREVKARGNSEQIKEIETMLDEIEIGDNCIAVAFWETTKPGVRSPRPYMQNEIAFPVCVSRPTGTTSMVNPYEEFINYCLDKYYPEFEHVKMTTKEFNTLGVNARMEFVKSNLSAHLEGIDVSCGDDSNGVPVVFVTKTLEDGSVLELFEVASEEATFVVQDSCFGEDRFTTFVDFRQNGCFDYLFDETQTVRIDTDPKAALTGQMIMLNDVPSTDCQEAFALCIMAGLIEFSGYQKFHKFNALKTNGIDAYIKTKFTFGGEIKTCYDFDHMYIIYSQDGKYKASTTKVASISYAGYAQDIDAFVESLTKLS